MNFLYFLLIGLAAGWIAGQILKTGYNLVVTLIVGVIGAILGGWLFMVLQISIGPPLVSQLIAAVVGALLFVVALKYLKKHI